jgi:hypothetical protein
MRRSNRGTTTCKIGEWWYAIRRDERGPTRVSAITPISRGSSEHLVWRRPMAVPAWLVVGLALAVAGCTSTSATTSPTATVVAAEASLAAAGRAELAYAALPVCTGANGPLCSVAAVKASAKSAFDSAYAAVTAAQTTADAGGSPDTTAMTAALSVLQSVLATLPKTGG